MNDTTKQRQTIEHDLRNVAEWLRMTDLWASWQRSRANDSSGVAIIDATVARHGDGLFWQVDKHDPTRVFLFKPDRAHSAVLREVLARNYTNAQKNTGGHHVN